MAGSVLIWAPPGRGRRVPGARNRLSWPPKNPGACFWGRKKPLREWGHAIPRFSIETDLFSRRKTQGRVFWGRKKPLREWPHAIPRFSIKIDLLGRRKNPGACFGGRKKPLREWPHALPSFRAVLFWLPKKPLRAWGHALPSCGAGWVSNPVCLGCDVRVLDH